MEGKGVPEPFDVRTEEALDASMSIETTGHPKLALPRRSISPDRNNIEEDAEEDLISSHRMEGSMRKKKLQQPFNPFCNVDQVQLSIHCHVNGVNTLVCAPGFVTSDISESCVFVCVCVFTSKVYTSLPSFLFLLPHPLPRCL